MPDAIAWFRDGRYQTGYRINDPPYRSIGVNEPLRPSILFLTTHVSYFLSHRMPLARHVRDQGYRIIVAAHADTVLEPLLVEGFEFCEVPFRRQGINPITELYTLWRIFQLYRSEGPLLVHHFSHKAILYGGMAARLAGIRAVVGTVTGLGYSFTAPGIKAGVIRRVIEVLYLCLLRFSRSRLIFQNPDDRAFFVSRHLLDPQLTTQIPGAGVNCREFRPQPDPEHPVVLTVARLLWSKGIAEVVAASAHLRRRGINVRFVLAGAAGDDNPQSIPVQQVKDWCDQGLIEWHGVCKDVAALLAGSWVVCLPSHREGLPLALAEALAAGRPVVTTDVPGCREVVSEGVNGFLVPVGDVVAIADRLELLLADSDLRHRMGQAGREVAESRLSVERVVSSTMLWYRHCLDVTDSRFPVVECPEDKDK